MSALRISVADDEADMRTFYQRMLTRLGHQVVACCANGRELVEESLQQMPDLVITDVKMPVLDGLRAVAEIGKQHPVPVILVTAYPSPELLQQDEARCIQAYLVKPIRFVDLAPAIELACRRFGQARQLRQEADHLREAMAEKTLCGGRFGHVECG